MNKINTEFGMWICIIITLSLFLAASYQIQTAFIQKRSEISKLLAMYSDLETRLQHIEQIVNRNAK